MSVDLYEFRLPYGTAPDPDLSEWAGVAELRTRNQACPRSETQILNDQRQGSRGDSCKCSWHDSASRKHALPVSCLLSPLLSSVSCLALDSERGCIVIQRSQCVHADGRFMAIAKPAGMVVQPAQAGLTGSVVCLHMSWSSSTLALGRPRPESTAIPAGFACPQKAVVASRGTTLHVAPWPMSCPRHLPLTRASSPSQTAAERPCPGPHSRTPSMCD